MKLAHLSIMKMNLSNLAQILPHIFDISPISHKMKMEFDWNFDNLLQLIQLKLKNYKISTHLSNLVEIFAITEINQINNKSINN